MVRGNECNTLLRWCRRAAGLTCNKKIKLVAALKGNET